MFICSETKLNEFLMAGTWCLWNQNLKRSQQSWKTRRVEQGEVVKFKLSHLFPPKSPSSDLFSIPNCVFYLQFYMLLHSPLISSVTDAVGLSSLYPGLALS